MRLECTSLWPHRGMGALGLEDVWRVLHLRDILGPNVRARTMVSPGPPRRRLGVARTCSWKAWWLWRQRVIAEDDVQREQTARTLGKMLLEDRQVIEAEIQPMKPALTWLSNLADRLAQLWQPRGQPASLVLAALGRGPDTPLGRELVFASAPSSAAPPAPPRPAVPLVQRWLSHTLVVAQAAVANEGHGNLERAFASCSTLLGMVSGTPLFLIALGRFTEVDDEWSLDVLGCPIPARASVSWSKLATEIAECVISGRSVSSTLCGARRIFRLRFSGGPEPSLRAMESAEALDDTVREVVGSRAWRHASGAGTCHELRRTGFEWLVAALCPPLSEHTALIARLGAQLPSQGAA